MSMEELVAGFEMAWLIVRILISIVAAIWIFRDAEARGKSGVAAALIVLCTLAYNIPLLAIVVCTWILLRPANLRSRKPSVTNAALPETLPGADSLLDS